MTRHVKIGEAKTHLSELLAQVEAGEDLIICRDSVPIARVSRIDSGRARERLMAAIRRDREGQQKVTTEEILAWRHEGHQR